MTPRGSISAGSSPGRLVPCRVLKEWTQNAATCLEKRMADDKLEEALEALAARFDRLGREAVGEDLARQRRDVDLHKGGPYGRGKQSATKHRVRCRTP
jgi:hypothetical protein